MRGLAIAARLKHLAPMLAAWGIAGCHLLVPFPRAEPDLPSAADDLRGKDSVLPDRRGLERHPVRGDALPESGLVAWYRLDEDSKTTGQALDSSGRGLHGTCQDPACPLQVPRGSDQAQLFDGIDDVFQIPDNSGFGGPGLTLALWIKMDTCAGGAPLSKPFGTGNLNSWQIECRTSDGQVSFTTTAGSKPDFLWTGAPAPKGVWFHLAATLNGGEKQIYLDGTLKKKLLATISYDSGPVLLGADRDSGRLGYYFAGALDDVRIYDRALSSAEVSALASH